jgi:hypothetical protein
MEKTCSTTLSLTAHPFSNTSNQRLKYHATKSEDGCTHFTRLAVAALLLPLLPNLTTVWNHNSIDSATFKLSAMPLDLSGFIFRRVAWSRTYHLSLKFSSKFNAPFSFNGKIMPTKNCDRACFFTKKIPHYVLLFVIGKTRSYFVTSNDEKLDDLEVSTKYC